MRILPPTEEAIAEAGAALRRGELVGMPTETVYGVAANALDAVAVRRTFVAKGRPSDNPLIVHVANLDDVSTVASEFPELAKRLAERFWPGPLTLVLPRRDVIPDAVTAGLDTVAVRIPAHPVARALIRAAGCPVSAPSANLFTRISPTRAEDIDPELVRHLYCILDGGPCEVGLESTVVDVHEGKVRLLRPGRVSRAEIEAVVGQEVLDREAGAKRSPGLHPRHYSPQTPVRLVESLNETDAGITIDRVTGPNQIALPGDPQGYGAGLYAALAAFDRAGHQEILIQSPPRTPEWEAIWDRLTRATGSAGARPASGPRALGPPVTD